MTTTAKPKSPRKSLSRRFLDDDRAPAIKRHAELTGEVVWAWNDLHFSFGLVFSALIGSDNPMIGPSIWAAAATDRAQRELLLAAIDARYASGRIRSCIHWAIKAANTLAAYRNDAVHTRAMFRLTERGYTTGTGYFGIPFKRILRLHPVNFPELMRTLRGDITQLSAYVRWIDSTINPRAKPQPSPRRPVLHTPRLFQAASSPKVHRKAKAPRRLPRSSRA